MNSTCSRANISILLLCLAGAAAATPANTAPPVPAAPMAQAPTTAMVTPKPAAPASVPAASAPAPVAVETPSFSAALARFLPANNARFAQLGGEKTVYFKPLIQRLYQANGQQPLWKPEAIRALAAAFSALEEEGLNPAEYRFPETAPYLDDPALPTPNPEEQAKVDILLTEAYLRALDNLEYGKVDPDMLDADSNYAPARNPKDRSAEVLASIKENRIAAAFEQARPKHENYLKLKAALKQYRQIHAKGGWEPVSQGKTKSLRPGVSDIRISQIRQRLAITGDMPPLDEKQPAVAIGPAAEAAAASQSSEVMAPALPASSRYDPELVEGVKRFQARHNLDADGNIGRDTIAAMNVPVEERVDQLRINMERQRWYHPRDIDEYLLVDVAGFHIHWMKGEEPLWSEKVQVGQRLTKTPIFRDQIEHIIFNPTWSVPPGINHRTILPSLKADPSYLDKKGYELLNDQGKPVDPYSVDWNTIDKMPFIVRQPPGKGNALGLVKFMFPNKFSVFLHDTNHRDLFSKQLRATSNGCIRLHDPFYLAEHLLARQGWDRARIDQVIATRKTTQTNLEKPLPILVQYSTALPMGDQVSFREDLYKRDGAVLSGLNGPFQLALAELPKDMQASIRARLVSDSASSAALVAPEAEIIGEPYLPEPVVEAKGPTKAPNYFDLP